MVLIVNASNITTGKCNMKPIQRTKIAEKPTFGSFNKEAKKAIEGKGLEELTDKLTNLKVKDCMKNIRITL